MAGLFDHTEKAAASILGVSPRTLRQWRKDGEIGYVRMPGGRIGYRADQLLTFQQRCRIDPEPPDLPQ